mmetsp:Transcript_5817/g.13736  ORF Transcript_5817/g.13736 Transcript_5817/m.13736 type:complete len:434 (-) Transcript_5817:288-1589(-)
MSTSSPRKNEPTSISQVSHRRDQWLRKEGQGSAPETDQECTFSPRINQVRGDMEAASEYLKQNVCDRLSRATPYSSYSGGPGATAGTEASGQRNTSFDGLSGVSTATSVSNMSTVASKKAPMGTGAFGQFPKSKGSGVASNETAGGGGGAVVPPPSPGRGQFEYVSMAERVRRASEDNLSVAESTSRSMDGTGTSVTSDAMGDEDDLYAETVKAGSKMKRGERNKMFADMMVRQNQHVAKSQENTKRLKEATTPSFKPALCNKSLQIMAPKGNFVERLQINEIMRRSADDKATAQSMISELDEVGPQHASEESMFKPTITKKAASMRPRSASEMSRGDLLKREETRRKVKERHAAELDSSMASHPKLTKVAQDHNSSRLKLREDPESYTLRVQEARRIRDEKLDVAKREKEVSVQCKLRVRVEQGGLQLAPRV